MSAQVHGIKVGINASWRYGSTGVRMKPTNWCEKNCIVTSSIIQDHDYQPNSSLKCNEYYCIAVYNTLGAWWMRGLSDPSSDGGKRGVSEQQSVILTTNRRNYAHSCTLMFVQLHEISFEQIHTIRWTVSSFSYSNGLYVIFAVTCMHSGSFAVKTSISVRHMVCKYDRASNCAVNITRSSKNSNLRYDNIHSNDPIKPQRSS